MLVAKGARAYEVLGINGGISDAPGSYLQELIENFEHTSKTRSLSMNEYFKYHIERGTPVLGVVKKEEKMEINKEIGQGIPNKLVLNVTGGAAFRSDALAGYYTGDEMIGFNFLVDEIEGGLIVFETPSELSKDVKHVATKGKFTTLEIKESKTKNEIQINDGSINLNINVVLKGSIGEETKGLDLVELNVKDAIEDACSEKVKEYISKTMDKAQKEFQIDSFGIDTLFHRKYPEEWKQISGEWDSIFPEINYNINVKTYILRTGLISNPVNIKMGEK
jgi:spore germination protein KC